MKPVDNDVSFPKLEEKILQFWRDNKITEKGLKANQGAEPFVFYDGPPFATGLPHYGHILPGTLKDIVPRYWSMKGKYVSRRFGWDCHGLPVEFEMEKELGLSGRADVEAYGIAKFNEACRGIVLRYTSEWKEVIERTGRWVDFENGYRTMDISYMESVWWALSQLWDKGLLYEGMRVMPYSWRISTPLSNFEAGLNYKEVQDAALTVKFKSKTHNRYFLAWTTTPWTLPSNQALCVNAEITYVELKDNTTQEHYVLAKDRVGTYFTDFEIVKEFSGAEIAGESYEPLFDFITHIATKKAFHVILGEHVTATDGTGIVHTNPAHGEDDCQVAQKAGIEIIDVTDAEGKFTDLVPPYKGMHFKDSEKTIIKDLKTKGLVFKHDTYVHNYAFCWRSDTPLMNKPISTWFLKVDPIKKNIIENNETTHWVPEHLKKGRFGNWLENARDWNISRNRYWGTPIPIWQTEDGEERMCVGSVAELEKLSGKKVTDLHKHYVDDITFASPKTGKPMKRIPEVLDCWFESGSMPFAQAHYPFENPKDFDKKFPAHFIAEGIDQTRGWFYTLSVLSSALFGKAPFKNVIVNGLVLAEDGKKMSKRLKNYPDPKDILMRYGADALRAYLMTSPASHAEDLRFSEAGVKEIIRTVLLPLWNAYSFFVTYALADGWSNEQVSLQGVENPLDRWVLSRLHSLVEKYEEKMGDYHLYEVIPEVVRFIDELTNWYIRLNRRRFWGDEASQDKTNAYSTLYTVLTQFTQVLAPILPFITESIYQNLKHKNDPESVHLTRFPTFEKKRIDKVLESEMAQVQDVVFLGRNLRNTFQLKTRQPLKEVYVISQDTSYQKSAEHYQDLIRQELNVKKVSYSSEESQWVTLIVKPNWKILGKRLGPRMKEFSAKISQMSTQEQNKLMHEGEVTIDNETFTLEDIALERQPTKKGAILSQGNLTVWLDTEVTEELLLEGFGREIVNRIQKLRKDQGLEVTDRIEVKYDTSNDIAKAFGVYEKLIQEETLALKTHKTATDAVKWQFEEDIEGTWLRLHLQKVT